MFIAAISLVLAGGFARAELKTWQQKMGDVAQAFSEVVPYLYPSPENDIKGLSEKVEKLRAASRALDIKKDHIAKTGDFDPGLIYLANSFQDDIDRAYFSLKEGHPEYAKYVLKESAAYCIACHTRTSAGAQFPLVKAFAGPLKRAPWIDNLEFQAATRQFDGAFDEVISQLTNPRVLSSLDLERGVRLALSIAVRVKQDPGLALKLADKVRSSKEAAFPLKEAAKDWRRDILRWRKEKPKTYDSASAMIKDARGLVKQAQGSPSEAHDEVSYLRATALLYDLLRKYPETPEMAEALYLIGVSYTPLQGLGLWNLQEIYFRACIHERPHSLLAEKCYKRFEESIIFGFTGSAGTRIPPPLQKQLQHLKNKAEQNREIL